MAGFFADYGLFLLKTLTIVVAIIAIIAAAAAAQKKASHEGLEVENLNKKYRSLADVLRKAVA
ncbi:MAG: protease SohB, partial [Woeseiaceae bacterium]